MPSGSERRRGEPDAGEGTVDPHDGKAQAIPSRRPVRSRLKGLLSACSPHRLADRCPRFASRHGRAPPDQTNMDSEGYRHRCVPRQPKQQAEDSSASKALISGHAYSAAEPATSHGSDIQLSRAGGPQMACSFIAGHPAAPAPSRIALSETVSPELRPSNILRIGASAAFWSPI